MQLKKAGAESDISLPAFYCDVILTFCWTVRARRLHRYYDPGTGRFLTRDPIGSGGVNLYAYTRNNPVDRVDPSGYARDTLTASFCAALRSPQGLREAIALFYEPGA